MVEAVVLWNEPDNPSFSTDKSIDLLRHVCCVSRECRIESNAEADRNEMKRNCKLSPAAAVFGDKSHCDILRIHMQHSIPLPQVESQELKCAS